MRLLQNGGHRVAGARRAIDKTTLSSLPLSSSCVTTGVRISYFAARSFAEPSRLIFRGAAFPALTTTARPPQFPCSHHPDPDANSNPQSQPSRYPSTRKPCIPLYTYMRYRPTRDPPHAAAPRNRCGATLPNPPATLPLPPANSLHHHRTPAARPLLHRQPRLPLPHHVVPSPCPPSLPFQLPSLGTRSGLIPPPCGLRRSAFAARPTDAGSPQLFRRPRRACSLCEKKPVPTRKKPALPWEWPPLAL